MCDTLLAIEDAAKALAGITLITKDLKLQTEYLGTRRPKSLCVGYHFTYQGDHLGFFFVQSSEVSDVSSIRKQSSDRYEGIWVTATRKIYENTKYVNRWRTSDICSRRRAPTSLLGL